MTTQQNIHRGDMKSSYSRSDSSPDQFSKLIIDGSPQSSSTNSPSNLIINGSPQSSSTKSPSKNIPTHLENYSSDLQTDEDNYIAKLYPCPKCKHISNSSQESENHMFTHYKVACTQCNFRTTTPGKLTRHMNVAHSSSTDQNKKDDQQNDKSEFFITDNDLKIIEKHSGAFSHPKSCNDCTKSFIMKKDFYDHLSEHHSALYRCQVPGCWFATVYKYHMNYHEGKHQAKKELQCPQCDYRGYTKTMIKSHMNSHNPVCRFRCATCNFSAKYANALTNHLKKHEGHKPGPVLGMDGSIPVNDPSSDFSYHVRRKTLDKLEYHSDGRKGVKRAKLDHSFDDLVAKNAVSPPSSPHQLQLQSSPPTSSPSLSNADQPSMENPCNSSFAHASTQNSNYQPVVCSNCNLSVANKILLVLHCASGDCTKQNFKNEPTPTFDSQLVNEIKEENDDDENENDIFQQHLSVIHSSEKVQVQSNQIQVSRKHKRKGNPQKFQYMADDDDDD